MLVKVETEVSKEVYELASGLGKFAVDVKKAIADGFQLGQDASIIIGSLMTNVVPGLDGIDKIPAEAKDDPAATAAGILIGFGPLVKELMPKA